MENLKEQRLKFIKEMSKLNNEQLNCLESIDKFWNDEDIYKINKRKLYELSSKLIKLFERVKNLDNLILTINKPYALICSNKFNTLND